MLARCPGYTFYIELGPYKKIELSSFQGCLKCIELGSVSILERCPYASGSPHSGDRLRGSSFQGVLSSGSSHLGGPHFRESSFQFQGVLI